MTLPPNPQCGGIATSKGGGPLSWPPPCCEVHLLPWGHDRSDLGILRESVDPDTTPQPARTPRPAAQTAEKER